MPKSYYLKYYTDNFLRPALSVIRTPFRETSTRPSEERYFKVRETTSRAEPIYFAICSWVSKISSEFVRDGEGGNDGDEAVGHAAEVAVLVCAQEGQRGVEVIVGVVDAQVHLEAVPVAEGGGEVHADIQAVVIRKLHVVRSVVQVASLAVHLNVVRREGDAVAAMVVPVGKGLPVLGKVPGRDEVNLVPIVVAVRIPAGENGLEVPS